MLEDRKIILLPKLKEVSAATLGAFVVTRTKVILEMTEEISTMAEELSMATAEQERRSAGGRRLVQDDTNMTEDTLEEDLLKVFKLTGEDPDMTEAEMLGILNSQENTNE